MNILKEYIKKTVQKILKENESSLFQYLNSIKSTLASAAQKVYDEWEQDEEGNDDIYGSGGICDDIASAMCDKIEHYGCYHQYDEYACHTSIYVYDTENREIFNVDIPPNKYETGYGYTWKKNPNVQLKGDDIKITELSYNDYFDENGDLLYDDY